MTLATKALIVFALFIVIATFVLLMPVVRYLLVGWHAKRDDILDGLNADSRAKYFQMFCKNTEVTPETAMLAMATFYTKWYGRRLYVAPALLLAAVGVTSIYLAIGSLLRLQGAVSADVVPINVGLIGCAGIAGAYMWVVNDLISRVKRLDFSPADVHWNVLRLTISIPMGYSIGALASESAGPLFAFAAGAFPLAALSKFLQNAVEGKLGSIQAKGPYDDEVTKLQGLTTVLADRLSNEDITTVTQVAYCDPIRLTMRSNLTFNVVTDLMNQAIAWEYLGEGVNKIRAFGIRGAVEVRRLMKRVEAVALGGQDPSLQNELDAMAKALDQGLPTMLNAFREISDDPFTDYLNSIWV